MNISQILGPCGDYPEHIIADNEDGILLGSVALQENQTYACCRGLCLESYPDFDFYHKFINYRSCDCSKVNTGKVIKLRAHGAYTFGYADACGMSAFGFQTLKTMFL